MKPSRLPSIKPAVSRSNLLTINQTYSWNDIYNNDTHVVTPYSQTNLIEDFAELAAYSIMDGRAAGGLAKYVYPSEIAMIETQLSDWSTIARPLVWTGNCNAKLTPSAAVNKASGGLSTSTSLRSSAKAVVKSRPKLLCSGIQL